MFKKINTYLLENYPSLWNLRIVPVLTAAIIIHLLFFIIAVLLYSNQYYTLDRYYSVERAFSNIGLMPVSIIISVLVVLVWLIYLLKNNAFKNFLPLTKGHLIKHFFWFCVIFFLHTSYFISFTVGANLTIRLQTPKKEFANDIKVFNNASVFFMHDDKDYQFYQKEYPKPFPFEVEEYNIYQNNLNKHADSLRQVKLDSLPNVQYGSRIYLFHKWDILKIKQDQNINLVKKDEFIETTDYEEDIYHKGRNRTSIIGTDNVEYYLFFSGDSYPLNDSLKVYSDPKELFSSFNPSFHHFNRVPFVNYDGRKKEEILEQWNQWFKNNQRDSIKHALTEFYSLIKKYHYETDLSVEQWLNRIPEDYSLKQFLFRNKPESYEHFYETESAAESENHGVDGHNIEFEYKNYLDISKASNIFNQINDANQRLVPPTLFCIYFWIAFCLSILLLIFRTTHIRNIIFSAVSVGVILLLIGLFATFVRISSVDEVAVIYCFVYLMIMFGSIFSQNIFNSRKIPKAIAHTLTLVGAIPFALAIFACLYEWTKTTTYNEFNEYNTHHPAWIEFLETSILWWPFIVGIIAVIYYCRKIKTWRASPE